jgi:purine-nucleoside phosphorylase
MTDDQPYATLAREAARQAPVLALVLGSGLGELARHCEAIARVAYADVPGMAATSVDGHKGCLTLAHWVGRRVLLFEGRVHHYEGHPWNAVEGPAVVAHALGARRFVMTNAAGGIHDALTPGSLMIVENHIEWTWPYCWRRCWRSGFAEVRPSPYTSQLSEALKQAPEARHIPCHKGIYGAVTGPCYETPAEIRALWIWGADAVGMSTAREAQKACELGMECAAVSLITNRAAGLHAGPISHEEVIAMGKAGGAKLAALLEGFLQRMTVA